MTIINRTKNSVITDSFEECLTAWQQTKGMMFRKHVTPLLFSFPSQKITKLHSWFCPGPMDLIFLNEEWEVVEVYSEWKPYETFSPVFPYMFLIELPPGTIAQSQTEVGDLVHIIK